MVHRSKGENTHFLRERVRKWSADKHSGENTHKLWMGSSMARVRKWPADPQVRIHTLSGKVSANGQQINSENTHFLWMDDSREKVRIHTSCGWGIAGKGQKMTSRTICENTHSLWMGGSMKSVRVHTLCGWSHHTNCSGPSQLCQLTLNTQYIQFPHTTCFFKKFRMRLFSSMVGP
ncbi:hypothetical protein EDD15DRAFT_2298874 [Pisolithus albus]|nr:hypothetical protein EDD15DRAFT_2298874 [Pisolithus albus]